MPVLNLNCSLKVFELCRWPFKLNAISFFACDCIFLVKTRSKVYVCIIKKQKNTQGYIQQTSSHVLLLIHIHDPSSVGWDDKCTLVQSCALSKGRWFESTLRQKSIALAEWVDMWSHFKKIYWSQVWTPMYPVVFFSITMITRMHITVI